MTCRQACFCGALLDVADCCFEQDFVGESFYSDAEQRDSSLRSE